MAAFKVPQPPKRMRILLWTLGGLAMGAFAAMRYADTEPVQFVVRTLAAGLSLGAFAAIYNLLVMKRL